MTLDATVPKRADVVIVGAGIVGCSAALELARQGVEVALFDKGQAAYEQSSRNWGWIRQNGRDLRELALAQLSRSIWSTLEASVGADVGWASEGNVHLGYDTDELAMFERWSQQARARGLETEVVGRAEVEELFPGLHDDHVGSIFSPLDAQADPHRAAPAIAAAAEKAGAALFEACAVQGLELRSGRVVAVETERGRVEAEAVIVAAGAWSSRLLGTLGVRLPQRRIHATVSATPAGEAFTRRVIWARGLAIRPDHEGSFILAAGGGRVPLDRETVRFRNDFRGGELDTSRREEVAISAGRETVRDLLSLAPGGTRRLWSKTRTEDPEPDQANVAKALQDFRRLLPAQQSARTGRSWAGYIDYTPDAVPVLERLDRPAGLVVATGFSGHGFALGPGGGRIAAELARGVEPSVDVHPFRLSRFAEGVDERELHF